MYHLGWDDTKGPPKALDSTDHNVVISRVETRRNVRNHADGIASIDLFVVPTISFRLPYGLLILRHDRRQILWLAVTAHPTAEWIARQLTEAFGWKHAPEYLIRDRDRVYGEVFTRRVRSMGIRDHPTPPRSPWQNGHAERLIGSIRPACLDHVVVFGERHLRHLLRSARTFKSRRYDGAAKAFSGERAVAMGRIRRTASQLSDVEECRPRRAVHALQRLIGDVRAKDLDRIDEAFRRKTSE